MIISKLMGGMGNQMFQYALGRSLSYQFGVDFKLDINYLLHKQPNGNGHVFREYDLMIFNIKENLATEEEVDLLTKRTSIPLADKILNKLIGVKSTYVREPHFHYSPQISSLGRTLYLEGYWQSERYFVANKDIIAQDFTFKEPMSEKAELLKKQLLTTNSVCVNVRRGDFVVNSFHGSYGIDYFRKAEESILTKVQNPHYYIFSDDIQWCKENLKFKGPYEFVDHQYAGKKFQDYLRLMSSCHHYIIPNSSFAWWAVWLNQNPGKIVIAPKVWFNDKKWDTKDLIPDYWERI